MPDEFIGSRFASLVYAIANHVGVKLSRRDPSYSLQWNGRDIATTRQTVDTVVHDIGHWLVCAPARRHIPDFGIGWGPDSALPKWADVSLHPKCIIPADERQREEERASLLGICYEYAIKSDFKYTFREHSWSDSSAHDAFEPTIAWLQKHTFIDSNGVPTRLPKQVKYDGTALAALRSLRLGG